MSDICKITAIIPSLNPTNKLSQLVHELIEAGFDDIIVVNDGSDGEHISPFEKIKDLPEVTVLTHPKRLGKGAALKTAFLFFDKECSDKMGAVTMDGDGQHRVSDVVKCARALIHSNPNNAVVLGVRSFDYSSVPKRSLIGNRISAFTLRVLFGIKLRDTQTGLRAILSQHIPLVSQIKGNRFEYETNMLLELKRNKIPFSEVPIETIYDEKNGEPSHFRPFRDSIIIFAFIFKYASSSFLSFIIDISVFWLAMVIFGGIMGSWSILGCTVIARVISSFFNFNINRWFVFQRRRSYGHHFYRYYLLVIIQMFLSAGFLWLLAFLLNGMQVIWLLPILKAIVDTILFFLSFYIQNRWVFKP